MNRFLNAYGICRGNYVEDNTLTVYIKRLRKKLDTNMIKTVKGLGYRLEV